MIMCPTTRLSIEECMTERACPVHKRLAISILSGEQQIEGLNGKELTMLEELED